MRGPELAGSWWAVSSSKPTLQHSLCHPSNGALPRAEGATYVTIAVAQLLDSRSPHRTSCS
eukprot:2640219-Alexandrium_andersonii.AAC.1